MEKNKESKFILEVFHPEYFSGSEHNYLKKIGNAACYLDFTDDIYKAKVFDSRKTAEKAAKRVVEYVKAAHDSGWTCYGYSYVPAKNGISGHYSKVMETIDVMVQEVRLIIVGDNEMET